MSHFFMEIFGWIKERGFAACKIWCLFTAFILLPPIGFLAMWRYSDTHNVLYKARRRRQYR